MALTVRRGGVLVAAAGTGLVALALLVLSLLQFSRSAQFNQWLAREDYQAAAQDDSPYGIFAMAYRHQQRGEFDAAIEQYARIENALDAAFRQRVRYNMATLYMQRALALRQAGIRDDAMPLIELAKHLYRELLRRDPSHWPARYNLEQALKVSPEVQEVEMPEDVMPERSPEATGSIVIDRELP